MVRVRTARAAGGQAVTRDDQQNRPCEKIIVRLRPVLQDELANGETQSALTTTHRGEVKLKLETATKRRQKIERFGNGKRQQQQQREGLPTVFQVDTVLGPGDDTSEVYAAAASRLVDRAITGGKALLLIAGTPGSGRSHTLWGAPLQQQRSALTPVAAAPTGIEEQGLLPLALADLSRRWSCGNGSPFYHSSSSALTAAAAAAAGGGGNARPRFLPPSLASASAEKHAPSPPWSFRLCVAEVLPGGREASDNEAGAAARDLLRGPFSVVLRPSTGGGDGDTGENKSAATPSPSPPRRWALSARDALAGLTSSSSASTSPPRSSSDRGSVRRRSGGGGGLRSRAWMGMGRGRGGAAAEGSLLMSRVLGGVEEVSAEGIEEALSLIREGLSNRRGDGHLVVSAKLVTAWGNDTRAGPTPEQLSETGELVFIELGDCPNGGLPQTLRNALSHLKVGHDHLESLGSHTHPASRSGHAAVTGTKGTPPTPTKQHRSCSNRRPTDNSPDNDQLLWALLSALADPGPGGAGALGTDRTVQGAAVAAATAAAAVTGTVAGEGRGLAGSRLSSRHPAGRGALTTAVTAEGIRAGARRSVNAAAAARDGPLVVSVVATLRSGDACYLQEKALLEALARSSRTRSDSWRRLPLGRILVSMPSFSWWSSHPSPASAAATAAMAAADGSAPAPAAAAPPSAPPVPSSEEVSLAMSNYSSARSGSVSSSSGDEGEEASAAATVAISNASANSAGLSADAEDDGSGASSPTPHCSSSSGGGSHGSKVASATVGANGMDSSSAGEAVSGGGSGGDGGNSNPREATVLKHLEEANSKGDDDGARVLATRGQAGPPRSKSGRRDGDGDGDGGVRDGRHSGLLTIEEADQAAYKDSAGAGAARTSHKEERRLSPPWDDSTLGLLGLTQDELIDRVLQAEKQSRHWKAQHALVERKLAALLGPPESRQTGGKAGGGVCAPHVPPMVGGGATGLPASASLWPAGRSPEHSLVCSHGNRTDGKAKGERDELLTASPCGFSAGTAPDTTGASNETDCAQAHEHRGGAEGEGSGGSCGSGKGEENSDGESATPETEAVESATANEPPSSGSVREGGVKPTPVHESIAGHLPRSRTAAADNSSGNKGINDDSSPPQQPLTFKERRAVFSSNNSVPVPPAAASLPWSSVAANTTAAAGKAANPTPPSPGPSRPRAGTRTSPHVTAFSPAAVEAARQNLKRSKIPAKHGSAAAATRSHQAAAAPGHISSQEREREREREGEGKGAGSRVSSDSRSLPQGAVSASPVPLDQGSSSAACSLSTAPCTPTRPLHHRRTSAPSPPAPSPCSTADRYRTAPGSPDSSSASGARGGGRLSPEEAPSSSPWSSSSSPPAPPRSTTSSPQLASPPSFPKPNAERRRARARLAENENWATASFSSMASSSMASSILESSATGGMAAAAARLPPTAPSAAPRGGGVSPQASAAPVTSSSSAVTSGSTTASPFVWSGTALRQRSVRLQHSPGPPSDASTASSLPSSLPSQPYTGAASSASRVAGTGRGGTGVYHGIGIGGGGGGGRRTTDEGFLSSKSLSAYPFGEASVPRTSLRSGGSRDGGSGGGGGGGGGLEYGWRERPAGVGPWPLFEQTREGRASLDEKQGITNGGANGGAGAGAPGSLPGGGVEKSAAPAAAAEAEAAADPEVSIGNISTMQASRLRALREKMERRYWPRRSASEAAATATVTSPNHLGNAPATIPEAPKSLDRSAYLGLSQVLAEKPRGSRQGVPAYGASAWAVEMQEQDGSGGRSLWNVSERM